MEIKITKENEKEVVYIEGRVDTVSSGELDAAVKPVITETDTLVFDCTEMEYISSSGLRVILGTHKAMNAKGGKLVLRHINKEVQSVIDLTGFSKILTIE